MDAQEPLPSPTPMLVGTSPPKAVPDTSDSAEDHHLELLACPEEPLQDDLPEHPEESLQDDLPERPEEPLQSDCCGTGCSPCVFDIYQEELERWEELARLTPQERAAARLRQGLGGGLRGKKGESLSSPPPSALSPREYRRFEVVGIERVSSDSCIYTFQLPKECVLGVDLGQHAVLRYLYAKVKLLFV